MTDTSHHRRILTFGRRIGHALKPSQRRTLEEWLPHFRFEIGKLQGAKRVFLEIGFGGGEHLHGVAKANPDALCIGCEPYLNGVVGLLQHLKKEPLPNVAIYPEDGRDLLAALPEASLDKVFILFPDPWPKVRHHKRRIVSRENLSLLARAMKPGGILEMATDDRDYAEWMLEHATAHPDFAWNVASKRDWQLPPEGWVPTRYEAKALAQGKKPYYYVVERK